MSNFKGIGIVLHTFCRGSLYEFFVAITLLNGALQCMYLRLFYALKCFHNKFFQNFNKIFYMSFQHTKSIRSWYIYIVLYHTLGIMYGHIQILKWCCYISSEKVFMLRNIYCPTVYILWTFFFHNFGNPLIVYRAVTYCQKFMDTLWKLTKRNFT